MFERVLLVEDEAALAKALCLAIEKLKMSYRHVSTLEEAHSEIEDWQPDLVLLDRMLPDGDGIEFCKVIRSQYPWVRVLILSALGQTEDKIDGLKEGADDYLPKPFSWEELAVRIEALARRKSHESEARTWAQKPPQQNPTGSQQALWSLNPDKLEVLGPKGWVEVTQLEFKLLEHLISAPGVLIGRDELLKNVWGFQWLPKTRTVDFFMSRIRKNFELEADNPKHFITVRGVGYRFDP